MTFSTNTHVNVLIVAWNAGNELCAALDAVRAACQEAKQWFRQNSHSLTYQILVWDNNSSDLSIEKLEDAIDMRLIQSRKNIGFAAANNALAMMCGPEDWLWLINPDTIAEPTSLTELLRASLTHPEFACFGSTLKNSSQRHKYDGLGDVVHLSGLAWRDGFGHAVAVDEASMQPYECFAVCGAALFIRKQDFDATGGFDEDFFCYQEDVDFGFRLRLMKNRAIQVPSAVIYHIGSHSTGGHQSDFAVFHGRRNLVWCYVKNMPPTLFWLCLPLHVVLNVVDLIYFTFRGQAHAIWRAKLHAMKGLPAMWRKRKFIQAKTKASGSEIWKALDKRFLPLGFKNIRAISGRRLDSI